jgi:hypothetical protein
LFQDALIEFQKPQFAIEIQLRYLQVNVVHDLKV